MRPHYRNALFASLILVICAGVLWAAYDWFQGRYLRPSANTPRYFPGMRCNCPPLSAALARIRLVHPGTRRARAMSVTSNTWAS